MVIRKMKSCRFHINLYLYICSCLNSNMFGFTRLPGLSKVLWAVQIVKNDIVCLVHSKTDDPWYFLKSEIICVFASGLCHFKHSFVISWQLDVLEGEQQIKWRKPLTFRSKKNSSLSPKKFSKQPNNCCFLSRLRL